MESPVVESDDPRTPSSRSYRPYWEWLLPVAMSIVAVILALKLWKNSLSDPWLASGDGNFHLMNVQTILEQGTVNFNPRLGAPLGMDLRDFPIPDTALVLLIQGILLFTDDPVTAFNVFYLLGFPLAALTAYIALRQLGICLTVSTASSVLYAFAPYHFIRFGHTFLAAYFALPLTVLLCIWIFRDQLRLPTWQHLRGNWKPLAGIVLICCLQASTGAYYTFFACYLMMVASVWGSLRAGTLRPALQAMAPLALTIVIFLLNISPSLTYWSAHGKNKEVANRSVHSAYFYALRPAYLFTPSPKHRVRYLSENTIKLSGNDFWPDAAWSTPLGVFGGVGLLWLLVRLPRYGRPGERHQLMDALSLFSIACIALGMFGGMGLLFNFFITSQFRCYERISILIDCLAVFSSAIMLDQLRQWMKQRNLRNLSNVLMIALLVICLLDQDIKAGFPVGDEAITQYQRDRKFYQDLEASLPPASLVYQLPHHQFPETVPIHEMNSYDSFRGFFHTKTLRWTYGATKGRMSDAIHEEIAKLPLEEQLKCMVLLDAAVVHVTTRAFEDRGQALIEQIQETLDQEPIFSEDKEYAVFYLESYAGKVKSSMSAEEFQRMQLAVRQGTYRPTTVVTQAASEKLSL